MSFIIIIVILIEIVFYRYLSSFWQQDLLPYKHAFILFLALFASSCLINYLWLFGVIIGIIIFALIFSQIIYSSYLWIFLLPWIKDMSSQTSSPNFSYKVYGLFIILIIVLILLTIINFFISDYMSLSKVILNATGNNYSIVFPFVIATMVIGNILRIYTMKKIS